MLFRLSPCRRLAYLLLSVLAVMPCASLFQGGLQAQQPAISPAVQILTAALGALSGGNSSPTEVVLTGSVASKAADTHTLPDTIQAQMMEGTVRLISHSSGMTRVEIRLSSGNQIETRRISNQTQAGESQVGSAAVSNTPLHNLLVDPAWFFPEHIVSRAISSSRPVAVLPVAQMDDTTAVGVDSYLVSTVPSHSATLRQMSEVKVFFDQTTRLPVELQFNDHANDSLLKIIPTRIVYGNYQSVQGHMVPFHIQRYEKGTLQQDMTITSAAFNSAIATSEYSLP